MDSIALQFAVVAFCVAQVRHKMATWAVGLLHQLAVGTAGCERACMQQCWCVLACLEDSALGRRIAAQEGCLHAQVAQFAAELERYGEAIELYEGIARQSVDNNLLKYSAKGYLLNAGICQLCSAPWSRMRDTGGHCMAMHAQCLFISCKSPSCWRHLPCRCFLACFSSCLYICKKNVPVCVGRGVPSRRASWQRFAWLLTVAGRP